MENMIKIVELEKERNLYISFSVAFM